MKRSALICIFTLLIFSLVSCSPTAPESSGGSNSNSGQDFDNDDDNDDGGNDDGGTTSTNNCTGTSNDGTGSGTSLHQFQLFLAGKQDWFPSDSHDFNDPLISQTMINLQEASILFSSDTKLQVRFKVHPQEEPAKDEALCYGRVFPMAGDAHNYTKLRLYVSLRDVLCQTPDPNNSSLCQSGFYLGPRYRTKIIDPISVGSCSPVIDFGALRNSSVSGAFLYATTVEIHKVQADSTCQYNGTHCPANDDVRTASCWRMTMQLATDYTQSFK